MDVRKFIMSDDFEKELTGTVRHEFMHAFDTYTISTKKREGIDKMKNCTKHTEQSTRLEKNG